MRPPEIHHYDWVKAELYRIASAKIGEQTMSEKVMAEALLILLKRSEGNGSPVRGTEKEE